MNIEWRKKDADKRCRLLSVLVKRYYSSNLAVGGRHYHIRINWRFAPRIAKEERHEQRNQNTETD
jgi:hypothetical protein